MKYSHAFQNAIAIRWDHLRRIVINKMVNAFAVKMWRVELAINVPKDFGILNLETDAKAALAI